MFIITKAELEHMSEYQLRELYHGILSDLARRGLSAKECPLTMVTLTNIQEVLCRKQALKPRF
jgi:hypothetical protein